MDETRCAPSQSTDKNPPSDSLDAQSWATVQFGTADLGDSRRDRRLVRIAAGIVANASTSLLKQFPEWSELMATYRFLSNDAIAPGDILAPHLALVRQQAGAHPVVLCLEDDTEMDYTHRSGISGLGQIGNGEGRGLLQHSALAALPDGRLLGILDIAWHAVQPVPENETRRQQQARWNISDVWHEAVQHIGSWQGPGMLVHVGDRHADLFRHLACCLLQGHQFVVRAMHDRYIDESTTRLWEKVTARPALGMITVRVGTQRNGLSRVTREGREAVLTIRSAPVRIPPPSNDPRTADWAEVPAWGIHLVEENPPEEVRRKGEAVEWMLLSSLPAEDLASALMVIGYYTRRWLIEEWHRCYKEGCGIEASQLDQAKDVQRLGAIVGVVAVRLLQMRDLADEKHPQANDPKALQQLVPPLHIQLVARLCRADAATLTPRQFFLAVAKRGGYLGRRRDPRPGWIVLWRGWHDILQMVCGAELLLKLQKDSAGCV